MDTYSVVYINSALRLQQKGFSIETAEIEDAFLKTWGVVEACLGRWSLDELRQQVTKKDAWGELRTITPAEVIWRLMAHEVHHGSEISLILRVHGLPTQLNR